MQPETSSDIVEDNYNGARRRSLSFRSHLLLLPPRPCFSPPPALPAAAGEKQQTDITLNLKSAILLFRPTRFREREREKNCWHPLLHPLDPNISNKHWMVPARTLYELRRTLNSVKKLFFFLTSFPRWSKVISVSLSYYYYYMYNEVIKITSIMTDPKGVTSLSCIS